MAAISTTVIGSMPQPSYLKVPSWIENGKWNNEYVEKYNEYKHAMESNQKHEASDLESKGIREVIKLQENAGVDVITDGELRRENYIYAFCRRLNGIDFENTKTKLCRNGAWEGKLPQVVSAVSPKGEAGWLAKEWKISQDLSKTPIKVTVPGPMTIMDTTFNEYYKSEEEFCKVFVSCINSELKALAAAGCKNIQIDEPVLVRYPDKAVAYGARNLSECFEGIPQDVFKTVHACCGYPQYLDQTDYEKADPDAYIKVASAIDDANFDAFSIEDAHRRNDPKLFTMFKKKKIVLGVIDVVKSRLETVEEIQAHIKDVLKYIPAERLIVAPDCGMLFLPMELAEKKLKNMCEAAKSIQ